MLSKPLIHFLLKNGTVLPPCYLTWGQTMVEVMKIMVTSFKRSMHAPLHSVPPTLQQAITDPPLHQRLLDTHGQVWVSLLLGHCSFLLGPGAHKALSMPSQSLFSHKFWWLYGGFMATSSKRAYAIPRSTAPRAPAPAAVYCWPVPLELENYKVQYE